MNITEIKYCPGTLAEGCTTYSKAFLRKMFFGKKVSHILPYTLSSDEGDLHAFSENRKRISISGVQEKVSLLLDKNKLRLTKAGEQGTYLLKPIPRDLKKANQVPANEHLTMQIAKQVYGIHTAENALVFFKSGEPAYITKRFDVKEDGVKLGTEDFASIAERTKEMTGNDFKYDYSYEEIAILMKKYLPAYLLEVEKFFSLVLFNYIFSNGDAHLKNFSVLESASGDYLLSPAYDLINTRLHVNDTDFALYKGLFKGNNKKTGHPTIKDFSVFAKKIGIKEKRFSKIIVHFLKRQEKVARLINHSFLDTASKKAYLIRYNTRRNSLLK